MIDLQKLRTDQSEIINQLSNRGVVFDDKKFLLLDNEYRNLIQKKQKLETNRNQLSKTIGVYKSQNKEISDILKEVECVNEALKEVTKNFNGIKEDLEQFLSKIPNVYHSSVPIGKNEEDNQVIKVVGKEKCKSSDYDHIAIGEKLLGINFEIASNISQSRFVLLQGHIARLHRAITQFMLDTQTNKNKYLECNVPILVNLQSMYNTGQLPKFYDDQFILKEDQLSLIPTAEVPLTNIVADQIIDEKSLPLKFTAHTPCFRREAGSYGKDTKGMIRQHQFEKVELVWIIHPDNADEAYKSLVSDAEDILQQLELPYRAVALCTGDLGFSAYRTTDLEVWLPGQNNYREISSCSHCSDFQARRMKARFKSNGKTQFVHTLNGSGLAVGRTLIAVLENYFDGDVVHIPKVLQPYMNHETIIK